MGNQPPSRDVPVVLQQFVHVQPEGIPELVGHVHGHVPTAVQNLRHEDPGGPRFFSDLLVRHSKFVQWTVHATPPIETM